MLGKKTKETIHLLVDKCTAGFCKEGSKFRVGAFSFHVLIIYWGGQGTNLTVLTTSVCIFCVLKALAEPFQFIIMVVN